MSTMTAVCNVIHREAGLTIALDDQWAVVPAYRYEHLFVTSNAFRDNVNISRLGLRYSFCHKHGIAALRQRVTAAARRYPPADRQTRRRT
jgi:hypothetical protein